MGHERHRETLETELIRNKEIDGVALLTDRDAWNPQLRHPWVSIEATAKCGHTVVLIISTVFASGQLCSPGIFYLTLLLYLTLFEATHSLSQTRKASSNTSPITSICDIINTAEKK